MATKVSAQLWDGASNFDLPNQLIGYCREEPQEVLRRVYDGYNVFLYKDVRQPVDARSPNYLEGLVIDEADVPQGCEVTGTLDDLDLDYHRTTAERDEGVYRSALRQAMKGTFEKYDGKRFFMQIPDEPDEYQMGMAEQFYEVMQVTLGIEEPGLDDLRDLLDE